MPHYALGLDYGTLSVRGLAVDCETGREIAQSLYTYPHGVITEALPGTGRKHPPGFALQSPSDYRTGAITVIRESFKPLTRLSLFAG